MAKTPKVKKISYSKWGYIFIAPFFITFAIFTFIPLLTTIYNSFFENYTVGLNQIGPTFIGFENYKTVLTNGDLLKYTLNTAILWIIGFIPQIGLSLLLAVWFTDITLKLKSGFFKSIIYMPNLIMAAAFSMLFFTLFSDAGPANNILISIGLIDEPIRYLSNTSTARGLIGFMNFLMWFGNTTILLMAGIMGINTSLFESAQVDGATSFQTFTKITLPLLKPILIFVVITSLIGGIQMFDVPQILTNGKGAPNRTTMTLIMYLNKHLFSKNYGLGGAVSVILFIVTSSLSLFVFRLLGDDNKEV